MPKFLRTLHQFVGGSWVANSRRYTLEEVSRRVAMSQGLSYHVVYNRLNQIMKGVSYE